MPAGEVQNHQSATLTLTHRMPMYNFDSPMQLQEQASSYEMMQQPGLMPIRSNSMFVTVIPPID